MTDYVYGERVGRRKCLLDAALVHSRAPYIRVGSSVVDSGEWRPISIFRRGEGEGRFAAGFADGNEARFEECGVREKKLQRERE